jgi:6-phosphogluconolactonase
MAILIYFFRSEENWPSDIHITPDGRYLYGANRGHNSIVMFEIDLSSGKLSLIGHQPSLGEAPRSFLIEKKYGKLMFVSNQNTDSIVTFRINDDGSLTFVKSINVLTPVCLKMYEY